METELRQKSDKSDLQVGHFLQFVFEQASL